MLTCIARTKKLGHHSPTHSHHSDPNNQPLKSITSQIKDMALKASGVYKHCGTCTGPSRLGVSNKGESLSSELESERFRRLYMRNGSGSTSRRTWGKELEERLKGISSGEGTPNSDGGGGSGRRVVVVVVEEEEGKEWVAQVESGVLITFLSLPGGGNHLRRIRFSRDIFNKWQAQRWWAENYDKVMELYNVQRVNHQAFPLPTPPRSEDESSKHESVEEIPVTPALTRERRPRRGMAMGYSSSDSSFDVESMQWRHHQNDSTGMNSTPKISTISAAKTEISSITSYSSREADQYSEDISISNVSDIETEWVEEDEPGVYITIKAMPGSKREIKRVRFSREKFGEVHARLWWEENRARIHQQYLSDFIKG